MRAAIMYGDFFDAPRTVQKPTTNGKAKVMRDGKGKSKSNGKGKGKRARFEVEEDDELAEEDDGVDDARDVMGRFKEDLFADDDDEDGDQQPEQGECLSCFIDGSQNIMLTSLQRFRRTRSGNARWRSRSLSSSRKPSGPKTGP